MTKQNQSKPRSNKQLSYLLNEAAMAWQRLEHKKTLALLERASRKAPANIQVLLELGMYYGRRYEFAAAERSFERAVRLSPMRAATLANAASCCAGFGRNEMATRFLERAVNEKQSSAEIMVQLAENYERADRLDNAEGLIGQALKSDGGNVAAMWTGARLARKRGRLEKAEQIARIALEKTANEKSDWATRVGVYYELGAVLDCQARYDEAMTALLEAKAIQRSQISDETGLWRKGTDRIRELQRAITPQILERWRATGPEDGIQHPLAILSGVSEGTTLLAQMLDAHSQIALAGETPVMTNEVLMPLTWGFTADEPFLQTIDSASPGHLLKLRNNYFRFIPRVATKPAHNRLLLDTNPSLTAAIPMLDRAFPNAKFIFCVLDPRDMSLSKFMQHLQLDAISCAFLSLEGAVDACIGLMETIQTYERLYANKCLLVRREDLVANPEPELRKILEFLGLPWEPAVLDFDKRPQEERVNRTSHAEAAKSDNPPMLGRWRNYERYFELHKTKLMPFVSARG